MILPIFTSPGVFHWQELRRWFSCPPTRWPELGQKPPPISGAKRKISETSGQKEMGLDGKDRRSGRKKMEWEAESHQLAFKDESPRGRLYHSIEARGHRQREWVSQIREELNSDYWGPPEMKSNDGMQTQWWNELAYMEEGSRTMLPFREG